MPAAVCFPERLLQAHAYCKKVSKGCSFCKAGRCIASLLGKEKTILSYRKAFQELKAPAQDRDILWIFGGGSQMATAGIAEPTATLKQEENTSDSDAQTEHFGRQPREASDMEVEENTSDSDAPQYAPLAASEQQEATSEESPGEVTSDSSSMGPLVDYSPDRAGGPPPAKRQRRYKQRRRQLQRRRGPSLPVQGIFTDEPLRICQKACELLLGIGSKRVARVLDGRPDGRTHGHRAPNSHDVFTSPQMHTCLRFLWKKYHFDAEGLPDRFSMERRDGKSLTIGEAVVPARSALLTDDASTDSEVDPGAVEEEDERAIASMALYAASADEPDAMSSFGPGMSCGPKRYIGVMKPVHLYLELEIWCMHNNLLQPSFNTFMRALHRCSCVRFRKAAGQHANCDACVEFKQLLRTTPNPSARVHVMEAYCSHLMAQWLDRGVDGNHQEVSLSCRRMLNMGYVLSSLEQQFSHMLLRIDGVDQAKFRVPRCLTKTHSFEKMIRPALHVQGAWAHGFAFHLAVADADMKKDTNNNVEVLARLLEDIYIKWKALPSSLFLIQDNTSRECKNQRIMKLCTKLVSLNILDSITLAYPQKGHTHGPLDGTFGQLCVKLSNTEFEDDLSVVEILNGFLVNVGIDTGSKELAKAYKLDEAACWIDWADSVDLAMSHLTGPTAPHYFRFCRRKLIGLGGPLRDGSTEQQGKAENRGLEPDGEDVVMIVKDRMASSEVSQIILMVPAADLPRLHRLELQPVGNHARRAATDADRRKVSDAALAAFRAKAISQKACDYLMHWAQGTRRRLPRPRTYKFLEHRRGAAAGPQPRQGRAAPAPVLRPVIVAPIAGHDHDPIGDVEDDDSEPLLIDPGPMAIA